MFLRTLRKRLGIGPKEDAPTEEQLELPFDPPLHRMTDPNKQPKN